MHWSVKVGFGVCEIIIYLLSNKTTTMSWWGTPAEEPKKEAESAPVAEPVAEPKEQEDLGALGNAWRYTTEGVCYGASKAQDGFVYVAVGGAETIGDGFEWMGDTADWAWTGTSTWAGTTFGCGTADTPKA